MVLGVCRRIVGDWAAADDAFQAVFLVLARRAAAVRPRSAVGNWLYGVAYRTAAKARAVLARRRAREKQVDTMPEPPASPPPDDVWSDVRPVIDEELARLPERLRLPVVLCDLEGRAQRQVAKHLNLPPATLATRLASARRLLATRLTRRGVALSGGALATVLCGHASAAVSPRLADGLARAAEAVCAGSGVGSLVSAHAVQLSEGVMRMMLLSKLRAVGAAALATLALTTGLGLGLVPARASDPAPGEAPAAPTAAPKLPPPAAPADDATFFRRACLDLRGTPPSTVEDGYFLRDADPARRRKVVEWLLTDEAVKTYQAKKLGVPVDRLHIVTFLDAGTVERDVNIADFQDGSTATAEITDFLNQSADPYSGTNSNAGVSGNIVLNEAYAELFNPAVTARVNANYWVEVYNPATSTAQLYAPYRKAWLNRPQTTLRYSATANPLTFALLDTDDQPAERLALRRWVTTAAVVESDTEFLRKVVQSARGAAPSAVEEKYFAEDTDPKKREKLLDLLLKDPAVAKKLGDDWKKKMLEAPVTTHEWRVETVPQTHFYRVAPRAVAWAVLPKQPTRVEKLVGELLAARKTDEQVLDGLSLVVLGRLPTESERTLTLAAVGKASDKKAAWAEVAKALSATEEAKKHAAELNKANPPAEKKPPEKK
jgi:RNA polymerase sigma factor (sigma-70 family)